MNFWSKVKRQWAFDARAVALRPAWAAHFKTPRDMLFHAALTGETLVSLPGWSGPVYLDSLAQAATDLPAPSAIVLYGSAVRDGSRQANDIDVLWLTDVPVAFPESKHFLANYIAGHPSGYGTKTYRHNCLHIAVLSEQGFSRSLSERTEWATTLLRDGVLLAGPVTFPGGRWSRAYALRVGPGNYVDSASLKAVATRASRVETGLRGALGVE